MSGFQPSGYFTPDIPSRRSLRISEFTLADIPHKIGLLCLEHAFLLPHATLPLNITDAESILWVEKALMAPHRLIGIIQPRSTTSSPEETYPDGHEGEAPSAFTDYSSSSRFPKPSAPKPPKQGPRQDKPETGYPETGYPELGKTETDKTSALKARKNDILNFLSRFKEEPPNAPSSLYKKTVKPKTPNTTAFGTTAFGKDFFSSPHRLPQHRPNKNPQEKTHEKTPVTGQQEENQETFFSPLYPIGCLGRISSFKERPDGSMAIILTGVVRFRIIRQEKARYETCRTAFIDSSPFGEDLVSTPHLYLDKQALLKALQGYCRKHGLKGDISMFNQLDNLSLSLLLPMLYPLSIVEKQLLLKAPTLTQRMIMLRDIFSRGT